VMHTAGHRLSYRNRHVQRPQGKIPFHAVAEGPSDDMARKNK
jgi:hypothetical protein